MSSRSSLARLASPTSSLAHAWAAALARSPSAAAEAAAMHTPAASFRASEHLQNGGSTAETQGGPLLSNGVAGGHVATTAPESVRPGSGIASARHYGSSADGSSVYNVGASTNIKWHETKVPKALRQGLLNQKGCVIWFTGLSGSGKSTLAYTLEHALVERGHLAYVLDGDNVRHGLNKNLGFSAADREENIRRVGEVAKLFADSGVITIVSFISPYKRDRLAARALLDDGEFLEVYMKIPLSVCEDRDPKGLYKLARAGKLKGFTGIDDPYEEPDNAEIVIEVSKEDGILQAPDVMAKTMLSYLESKGIVPGK